MTIQIEPLDSDQSKKILLVEEIWDSIPADAHVTITPAQRKLLKKRENELLEGKVKTMSWGEIKKDIQSIAK